MTDQRNISNQVKCGKLLSLLWLLTGGHSKAAVSPKGPPRMDNNSRKLHDWSSLQLAGSFKKGSPLYLWLFVAYVTSGGGLVNLLRFTNFWSLLSSCLSAKRECLNLQDVAVQQPVCCLRCSLYSCILWSHWHRFPFINKEQTFSEISSLPTGGVVSKETQGLIGVARGFRERKAQHLREIWHRAGVWHNWYENGNKWKVGIRLCFYGDRWPGCSASIYQTF